MTTLTLPTIPPAWAPAVPPAPTIAERAAARQAALDAIPEPPVVPLLVTPWLFREAAWGTPRHVEQEQLRRFLLQSMLDRYGVAAILAEIAKFKAPFDRLMCGDPAKWPGVTVPSGGND